MNDYNELIADIEDCLITHPSEQLAKRILSEAKDAIDNLVNERDTAVALKHGRWISSPYKKARFCSRCYADEPYKFAEDDADVYDYCPHCGAKMDEVI